MTDIELVDKIEALMTDIEATIKAIKADKELRNPQYEASTDAFQDLIGQFAKFKACIRNRNLGLI